MFIAMAVPYKGSCVSTKLRPELVTRKALVQTVLARVTCFCQSVSSLG
jgi:hypothetical protein